MSLTAGRPDRCRIAGSRDCGVLLERRGVLSGPLSERDRFLPNGLSNPVGHRVKPALAHGAPDVYEGIDVGSFPAHPTASANASWSDISSKSMGLPIV